MTKQTTTKRDMILDSAYHLFQANGYHDTKIIDIAEKAGIGKGTVYEYFDSKESILFQLFQIKILDRYENLSDIISSCTDCENKIKQYIDFELKNLENFVFSQNLLMDLMKRSYFLQNTAFMESIHKLVNKKFSFVYRIIEEGIEKGEFAQVDSLLATISVMGAINFYVGFHSAPFQPLELLASEKIRQMYTSKSREEFNQLIINILK